MFFLNTKHLALFVFYAVCTIVVSRYIMQTTKAGLNCGFRIAIHKYYEYGMRCISGLEHVVEAMGKVMMSLQEFGNWCRQCARNIQNSKDLSSLQSQLLQPLLPLTIFLLPVLLASK